MSVICWWLQPGEMHFRECGIGQIEGAIRTLWLADGLAIFLLGRFVPPVTTRRARWHSPGSPELSMGLLDDARHVISLAERFRL